jgi:chromosome segregation and condensation protein ScpB
MHSESPVIAHTVAVAKSKVTKNARGQDRKQAVNNLIARGTVVSYEAQTTGRPATILRPPQT